MPLLLSNKDVEKVLDIRECMDVLEHSFKDYADGRAVNRPRSHLHSSRPGKFLFAQIDGRRSAPMGTNSSSAVHWRRLRPCS